MPNVRFLFLLMSLFSMVGCSEPKQPAPPTAEEQAQADLEAKAAEDAEMEQSRQAKAQSKRKKT